MQASNTIPFKKFIPGILWFLVIMVLVCLPGDKVPSPKFLLDINFDKIVHISMFGILLFLFFYPLSRSAMNKKQKLKWLLILFLGTVAFGYITELLQLFFIPNRSYDLVDFAADSLGALLAFGFCRWRMV